MASSALVRVRLEANGPPFLPIIYDTICSRRDVIHVLPESTFDTAFHIEDKASTSRAAGHHHPRALQQNLSKFQLNHSVPATKSLKKRRQTEPLSLPSVSGLPKFQAEGKLSEMRFKPTLTSSISPGLYRSLSNRAGAARAGPRGHDPNQNDENHFTSPSSTLNSKRNLPHV